jgi:HK97 family phage prohead protease
MTQLQIEYRSATQVGVKFPERLIELIVMPYETETRVMHHGRLVREIVTRGAFDGLDANHRRVTVNRGHVTDNLVGRAVRFDPDWPAGLFAEVRIAPTDYGTETLTLAAEGLLDASAGFGVMDDGEQWPERGLRRLTKLWLDHIAMVPDPAYETANVLAVREQQPTEEAIARPNLDVIRGWRLADRYAMIE